MLLSKTLRIHTYQLYSGDSHRAGPVLTRAPDSGSHLSPKPAHTHDICSALCAPERDKREICSLRHEGVEIHHHHLYRAETADKPSTASKSLQQFFKLRNQSPNAILSRKSRLQIAVILASSVLQLDGTLWLKSEWTSADIFFHHKSSHDSEYAFPYLYWQRCCSTNIAEYFGNLCLDDTMIRSKVLLALGLTLVELCFGRTLADMWRPEDGNVNEGETRRKTASRLHQRVYDEMGVAYGDAVRRCVFQLFDVRELSLDIEEVQQKVFNHVLTPLVESLKNFTNAPQTD